MKKIFYIIIGLITHLNLTFADSGILGNSISEKELREGKIHIDDIPNIIIGITNFLLGIAGTISIIFIILGAYKILLGSAISGDKTEGKNTIIMALTGFAIASLSWFIIKLVIDNFS